MKFTFDFCLWQFADSTLLNILKALLGSAGIHQKPWNVRNNVITSNQWSAPRLFFTHACMHILISDSLEPGYPAYIVHVIPWRLSACTYILKDAGVSVHSFEILVSAMTSSWPTLWVHKVIALLAGLEGNFEDELNSSFYNTDARFSTNYMWTLLPSWYWILGRFYVVHVMILHLMLCCIGVYVSGKSHARILWWPRYLQSRPVQSRI